MAKPGPKPKPTNLKILEGTDQPCRRPSAPSSKGFAPPERPKWLKGAARKIWDSKLAKYEQDGLDVSRCGDALAQFCALEAKLINLWRQGVNADVPMALYAQYRVMANEFFETPASRLAGNVATNSPQGNMFANNGRPTPTA